MLCFMRSEWNATQASLATVISSRRWILKRNCISDRDEKPLGCVTDMVCVELETRVRKKTAAQSNA